MTITDQAIKDLQPNGKDAVLVRKWVMQGNPSHQYLLDLYWVSRTYAASLALPEWSKTLLVVEAEALDRLGYAPREPESNVELANQHGYTRPEKT